MTSLLMLFVCVVLCLQYGLFTTVHKHYTVEDWVAFAKTHPDCLKVLCACVPACVHVAVWQILQKRLNAPECKSSYQCHFLTV